MNIIAKLIHGSETLDLNSGRYKMGYDFEPPYTNLTRAYGRATLGAELVETEPTNRGWRFSLVLTGANPAEVERARKNLANFLARAGDESEPLYFAWRLWDDYAFEPLWGSFGAFERLEIVSGDLVTTPNYYLAKTATYTVPNCTVNLVIKPYAQIRRQQVLAATGGVVEFTVGMKGKPLGTMILPDSYNDFTNPVFGNTTWDNNWTVSSGNAYENTDPRFVLFGKTSAKLINDDASVLNFTESITPTITGDMVISCFIKRYDATNNLNGTNIRMYRDGTIGASVNIYHIADGWHFVWKATTGKGGAGNYGISILTQGEGYYVDGFCLEPGTVPTFLTYGDQPGSTWTGTAHASKSTRTDGTAYLAASEQTPIEVLAGTMRVVLKCFHPYSELAASEFYLFNMGGVSGLTLKYDNPNTRWEFSDGTTTLTATDTFDEMETIVLHAVWDASNSEMRLSLNGVLADTDTYTTLASLLSYNFEFGALGAAQQAPFIILDWGFFDQPMTAAQVTADYNLVTALAADNERVGMFPYSWTKTQTAGETGLVYNANDDTYDHYAVVGGLLGDRFITELRADMSADWSTIHRVFMGHLPVKAEHLTRWLTGITGDTKSILYRDLQGIGPDSTLVGSQYKNVTIGTSRTTFDFAPDYTRAGYDAFRGRDVYGLFRLYDAGSDLQAALSIIVNTQILSNEYVNLDTTTAYRLYVVGPLKIHSSPEIANLSPYAFGMISLKRTTGSANVRGDWVAYFPNLLSIGPQTTINADSFFLREDVCWIGDATDDIGHGVLQVQGTPLRLEANMLNVLMFAMGGIGDNDPLITWTLELEKIYIRPLYLL